MDRLPPLRLLMTFDTIARLRSMQLAAAELNVTAPAVSQAVKALEDQVGVALLDRRSKPSRMTEAGERLAQATRAGLGMVADAIEEIRVTAGLEERHLTVSCTIGMATYWLMPRLPDFYARHETITVNVQAPPSDLPALAPGIDVALRYGAAPSSDGETRKLFDESACPVGRPAQIAALGHDPEALVNAPLIHVRAPAGNHWASWPEYFRRRALPRHRGPVQVFDNYIQAVQAALDGRGIMLGWRSITENHVQEGALAPLEGGAIDLGTAYYMTCARTSLTKPAAQEFVAWLAGICAPSTSAAPDPGPGPDP